MRQAVLEPTALRVAVPLLLCALLAGTARGDKEKQTGPAARRARIQHAIGRVYPALVRVDVVALVHRGGKARRMQASGSGVVIDAEGHVVTNHHVAGHAVRIRCLLPDRTVVPAELVGTDALADVAVLRLRPAEGKKRRFRFAAFGDSDALKVGNSILAMGSPGGTTQSVTLGIVSNPDLVSPREGHGLTAPLDGEDTGTIVKWIHHDAAGAPGNSGGPLVNLKGEVVGINEIGSQGFMAAIPGNLVRRVAKQIIEFGFVRRSWTGIVPQRLLAGTKDRRGVLVADVVAGSPAAQSGVRPGDQLLEYAGRQLRGDHLEDLPAANRILFAGRIGEPASAVLLRDGRKIVVEVTPTERVPAQLREREVRAWGMTARPLTPAEAERAGDRSAVALLITGVRPGGPAGTAQPPIRVGDLILRTGASEPGSSGDLLRGLEAGVPEGRPVVVLLQRGDDRILTAVAWRKPRETSPPLFVRRPWIPVVVQRLGPRLAKAIGQPPGAARVVRVVGEGSEPPGQLRVGDVITSIGGVELRGSANRPLTSFLGSKRVGDTIMCDVHRGGRRTSIPVRLVRQPAHTERLRRFDHPELGFVLGPLTRRDREIRPWLRGTAGLLVREVESGGWAMLAGLRVGDVVLTVDGAPAKGVSEVAEHIESRKKKRAAWVVFHVRREARRRFVAVETNWNR